MSNKILGNYGEELARRHLEGLGYKILETKFRNKIGEIDIIAKDGNTVCFLEVKTRRSLTCGQPYESVTKFKMRKIVQVALSYLKYKFNSIDIPSRFDVISITTTTQTIQHIKNAFDLTYL